MCLGHYYSAVNHVELILDPLQLNLQKSCELEAASWKLQVATECFDCNNWTTPTQAQAHSPLHRNTPRTLIAMALHFGVRGRRPTRRLSSEWTAECGAGGPAGGAIA